MASRLSFSCTELEVLVLSCCLLLLCARVKAEVPALYVFGDSLVDVGNNNHLSFTTVKANFPFNGVDYPRGEATGRFSNGKVFADFLAEKLAVPSPQPYLSIEADSKRTRTFLKGVSFASAGAGALDFTRLGESLTLNMQVDCYAAVYTDLVHELGSNPAHDHLSKSIFAFIVGSNDILQFVNNLFIRPITQQQLVNSMVSSFEDKLKRMYSLGARKFAIVSTGPIGCCPQQRLNSSSGECNARTNNISVQYGNSVALLLQKMKSEHTDMIYSFFNSFIAVQEYIENSQVFGFSEGKAACCGALGRLNAKIGCLPFSDLCANRSSYIFWDQFHPTEATARLLSDSFFTGGSPYVFPVNGKQLSDL